MGTTDEECNHRDSTGDNLLTANTDYNQIRVFCGLCGMKWTAIPANTRIHSGMFDIIKDAILEDRYQDAKDVINQYYEWNASRLASEKQLTVAAVGVCPQCNGDDSVEARSARHPATCFYCHGLGIVILRPIGSGG